MRVYRGGMGERLTIPWRDALLPGAIAAAGVLEMALLHTPGWQIGAALEVLACALLVVRRSLPVVSGTLAALLVFVIPWFGLRLDEASVPIGVVVLSAFTLGRYPADRRGLVGVAIIFVVIALTYALVDPRTHNWGDAAFVVALFFPPYVLGRLVRRLALQSAQLLAQQEWIEHEAAKGERLRIARELHDVLAHSLSAMVVQTAAARDVVRSDPARAEAALDAVAAAGRGALAETGRLLHALRDDENELSLLPVPSLERLGELLDDYRDRGLQVEAFVGPEVATVPAAVSLSAYRIVQESLTNALRYSTDGTAAVDLRAGDGVLQIRVSNPCDAARLDRRRRVGGFRTDDAAGVGATAGPSALDGTRPSGIRLEGSGLGLAGMAERVALFGGSLDEGVDDGRYVVTAILRWSSAESAGSSLGRADRPGRAVPNVVEGRR